MFNFRQYAMIKWTFSFFFIETKSCFEFKYSRILYDEEGIILLFNMASRFVIKIDALMFISVQVCWVLSGINYTLSF